MSRVHVPFDEPTLAQIDEEVEKSGTSRSQWLSSAVAQHLALMAQLHGSDPATLAYELTQQKIEYEKLWKENQQLKRTEEAARKDVDHANKETGSLKDQLAATLAELETLRRDVDHSKRDLAHAMDTIGSRDRQIAFYEAQIANLIQSLGQLSIKPGPEEIKKKGWWQFWR